MMAGRQGRYRYADSLQSGAVDVTSAEAIKSGGAVFLGRRRPTLDREIAHGSAKLELTREGNRLPCRVDR